eukprot:gene6008-5296_t
MGRKPDLMDLQRLLMRSKSKLTNNPAQNIDVNALGRGEGQSTRWAVFNSASLLRRYKKEHEALMEAMARGAPVVDCVTVPLTVTLWTVCT